MANPERKAQLRKQVADQRKSWLELDADPPRRALWIRRPSDDQMQVWMSALAENPNFKSLPVLREVATSLVVDWRKFTEADLLGAAVGSDAAAEFDGQTFIEWAWDDSELLLKIYRDAQDRYNAFYEQKAAAEKN